ncbi:carbohydrate deacetylase [Adhaeribacter aerolatus]|uniref:Carbohydrate deacetylase n=1 Tax=Adhaeribacter aerolatus TaxID=670289 RepID=A0A512B350_9BACT|nr:polysaccharide deacetylase family protein [Adhaeribacter aerolatus]GEO06389.1 carbohydrate deacetylase [Adhaeribacter aerolatus]
MPYSTHHLLLCFLLSFLLLIPAVIGLAQKPTNRTYAEKLGWKKGDRVLILHIDDAGMSYDSNIGTIKALEEGVANSVSVMMPCPWVPDFVKYLKKNPQTDAGLHLTLTSEWQNYRWGPLTGQQAAPGLVDAEGALWPSVNEVTRHASPDEVEAEIRAQLARARRMGFEPTHLDSHMGTLFAHPQFTERYLRVGIQERIPVMLPAGHNTLLIREMEEETKERLVREGKWKPGMTIPTLAGGTEIKQLGQQVWDAGLPVLDDLHNTSYGWNLPANVPPTDENLRALKVKNYVAAIKSLKPGVTMMIMHCTDPTEVFPHISTSGPTRKGDLLAMLDPAVRQALRDEKIILTTWRELKERRTKVATQAPMQKAKN